MSQSIKGSALESGANMVTGIVLNQIVLWFAHVPFGTASAVTVIMILVSTLRAYAIRRAFNRLPT